MPSPSAALRRSRAFALSATPEKLAGGGATTADYVLDLVSQPAQGNGGEYRTAPHGTAPTVQYSTAAVVRPVACLTLKLRVVVYLLVLRFASANTYNTIALNLIVDEPSARF